MFTFIEIYICLYMYESSICILKVKYIVEKFYHNKLMWNKKILMLKKKKKYRLLIHICIYSFLQ